MAEEKAGADSADRFPAVGSGLFLAVLALGLTAGLVQPGWAQLMEPHLPSRGLLRALVVFARFQDEDDGTVAAPDFAARLFDPELPGSLSHFYREMSRGQFELSGEALPRWYTSRRPASAYLAPTGQVGKFGSFVREVLEAVDADTDLGLYDNDGPDGLPNSGDDDGFVDLVFITTRSAPEGFIAGQATGVARLGLGSDLRSDDRGPGGRFIRIRGDGNSKGIGGVVEQGPTFSLAAGSMAHEFGHALGLPDLFDLEFNSEGFGLDPELDSAGIGAWGLMGRGASGWKGNDGPNPFCVWSLEQLGWIGADNKDLVVVEDHLEDVVFDDLSAGGKVYKLPTDNPDEYFLIDHRRPGTSFYERDLPAGGLLIWHINRAVFTNDNEEFKRVDLVCADGLFLDAGFPLGRQAAPQLGRDNLDFWAHDQSYSRAHGGNLGDATDAYDGERFTEFSAASNPASISGISVARIRRRGESMVADLNVRDRRRAGIVRAAEEWRDTVQVVGDVVVPPESQLSIRSGTVVLFGRDRGRGGLDPERCELIVQGKLSGRGGSRNSLVFTSDAAEPRPGDWYGIVVQGSGLVSLRRALIEYAQTGLGGSELLRAPSLAEVLIRRVSAHGVDLANLGEPLELKDVEVMEADSIGVRVAGRGVVRVRGGRFTANGRVGLERRGGFVECLDSEFADNGRSGDEGANVVLGSGVFGRFAGNRVRGGIGVRCLETEEVAIEQNHFTDQRIGIWASSARPRIVDNEFIQSELVFLIDGFRVPVRIELNAADAVVRLVENRSAVEVVAANNWWGRADEEGIAAGMEGIVQWRPFLNFNPRLPIDFKLEQNYPNPFNGSTVINYAVGLDEAAVGSQGVMVLEIRNAVGGLVRRLVDRPAAPGMYMAVWDGRNDQGQLVASGVYFYQLRVKSRLLSRKLLLIR